MWHVNSNYVSLSNVLFLDFTVLTTPFREMLNNSGNSKYPFFFLISGESF